MQAAEKKKQPKCRIAVMIRLTYQWTSVSLASTDFVLVVSRSKKG